MERARIQFMFSLAVGLVDVFTGLPPSDPTIEVGIAGIRQKALRKPDGYYVFTNLPQGEYQLEIASRVYYGKRLNVIAGMKTSIMHVPLLPRPSYAYPPQTTGVRLMVVDQDGRAQPDVTISATLLAKDCYLARTLEPLKSGDRKIRISGKTRLIARGDTLYLTNHSSGEGEYVVIQDKDEEEGWLEVAAPLQGAYPKSAALCLVSQGITSETGEAILGFRQCAVSSTPVRLRLERSGREAEHVLNIAAGAIHNVGNVVFL